MNFILFDQKIAKYFLYITKQMKKERLDFEITGSNFYMKFCLQVLLFISL